MTVKNGSRGSDGKDGTNGKDGADGKDGKTPVRGADYWTPSDKTEIINSVLAAIKGTFFGSVDENNNIILSGILESGTYTIKYEDVSGNAIEVGTFVVGNGVAPDPDPTPDPDPEPTYTNLFNPDTATLNTRFSNSSGTYKDENGIVTSDYIPVTLSTDASNHTIMRFRGATFTTNCTVIFYNSSKKIINSSTLSTNGYGMQSDTTTVTTDENGDYQISLGYKSGKFDTAWTSGVAYMRVSLKVKDAALTASDVQNIIITVNEPIKD